MEKGESRMTPRFSLGNEDTTAIFRRSWFNGGNEGFCFKHVKWEMLSRKSSDVLKRQ
jgi:hypothetical protein